ncbi:MAG: M20 metallopeptidase family protein [Bacillota bacterium]
MLDYKLINKKADQIEKELIKWRRDIHKNPELGFKEYDTSDYIVEKLEDFGVEYKRICDTGVVGLIQGKKGNKTVALRADIDALAIKEKNDLDFKSQNEGVMHACGHDGHTAILLGTAKVLSEMEDDLEGSVKLIFQPAEEGPGGAKPMIDNGVLENPAVDYILGLHIYPGIDSNMVGLKEGKMMAAPDYFKIKVKGTGTHGARPQDGVDPITIGSHLVIGLNQLKARETDTLEPLVITCGSFHSGDAFNAIPDEAVITGTVRSFDNKLRKHIKQRIEEITKNITSAYNADYEYNYTFEYPPAYNNPEITKLMKKVVSDKLGQEFVYEISEPSMGGDDFAYFTQKIPGTHMRLGTRNEKKGITNPLHSPYFNLDEGILKQGVKLFVNGTNEILNQSYQINK